MKSEGGGSYPPPCSYGLLVIRGGLVALNDSVGFNRDRYPLCKIGMFDQDFQQLFQSFYFFIHRSVLLSGELPAPPDTYIIHLFDLLVNEKDKLF